MADPRIVKSIEQRCDLQFNRRSNRARWSMRAAMIVCAIVPLAYLGVAAVRNDRTIYWSRPVSTAHEFIKNDCAACHTKHFRPLARLAAADTSISSVDDSACSACHVEGLHDHAKTMINKDVTHCAMCHREHRQTASLDRVSDAYCVNCHRDLQSASDSEPSFARRITSWKNHPEFAVLRGAESGDLAPGERHRVRQLAEYIEGGDAGPGWRDRGKLRFNHQKHLADRGVLMPWDHPESAGETAARKQLDCRSCHETDDDGRYMRPVNYQRHCAQCHTLSFSEKLIPGGPLPHVAPELLRGVMRERLMQYAQQHPERIAGDDAESRLPNKSAAQSDSAKDRWEWVEREMARRQGDIFRSVGNGCAHCHQVHEDPAGDAPFTIEPTQIPSRWLPHSKFRHDRHDALKCTECHAANRSGQSGSIIMPSIEACQACHGAAASSGQARSDCVECHEYHHTDLSRPGLSLRDLAPRRHGRQLEKSQ